MIKKKIKDLTLSKKAELCISSDIECPKSCKFLTDDKKCKLVEKKYQNEEIEVEDNE